MPRYDFKCSQCGVTFEALVPTEVTALPCTSCSPQHVLQPGLYHGTPIQATRQLSAPARIHIH